MSTVIRVAPDGNMSEEMIDHQMLWKEFNETHRMTFVGGMDDIGCFIVGSTTGLVRNINLVDFVNEHAFDDMFIVGSDIDGNRMDISIQQLQTYLNGRKIETCAK